MLPDDPVLSAFGDLAINLCLTCGLSGHANRDMRSSQIGLG